jgi:hypothetical protein
MLPEVWRDGGIQGYRDALPSLSGKCQDLRMMDPLLPFIPSSCCPCPPRAQLE